MPQRDVYVRYSNNAVVRTFNVTVAGIDTTVVVDLDAIGEVVGVECLDVDTVEIDGREVA